MKKHLLIISAMAFAVSTPGAAALEGNGTVEDPYRIATAIDLKAIATIDQTDYSYYILMNDIDMGGQAWTPLFPKEQTHGRLHFDGNGHVISNMSFTGSYASLFGNLDGSVTNLGVVDCLFNGPGEWDPSGVLAAYAGFEDVFTAEGCFAIGTVTGYYAGGMIGGTQYGAKLTNCYSAVDASATGVKGGLAAGICACINYSLTGRDNTVTVENCFVEGNITGVTSAGGIVGGNQTYNHPANCKEIFNMTNVVVFSNAINGGAVAAVVPVTASPIEVNAENVLVSDMTKVNNEAVVDAVPYDDAVAEVLSWPAFMMNEDGELCLKWEIEGVAGVSDVTVDETVDGPAVYYNLQGVRVDNPANGVYIVRRGNKAYKTLVK